MQVPLEIAFHNVDKSAWVESQIRERVAKLDKIYKRLTACRVRVEASDREGHPDKLVTVRIEMSVPGKTLVVTNAPHRPQQRYRDPNNGIAIRDAFAAAERQLKAFKQQIGGEVKAHEEGFRGQITEIFPDADHGFILNNQGSSLYFHRNSMLSDDFDALKPGDPVHYIETVGDTGPIATKVWRAAG
jgi:cold shock CspA family protein/ribosome-associated translation inhibitor RaiA